MIEKQIGKIRVKNGDKGDTGVTPNITAKISTLAVSSIPTVTKSGTPENPTLEFGIPESKGIESTVVEYASHTNGTNAPASGWQSAIPTVLAGAYLWTRRTTTFNDKTTTTEYINARQGLDGSGGGKTTVYVNDEEAQDIRFYNDQEGTSDPQGQINNLWAKKLTIPTGTTSQLLNGQGTPITPTATPASGSMTPFTAGGAFAQLAGKEPAIASTGLPVEKGGTGRTSAPTINVNLASTAAAPSLLPTSGNLSIPVTGRLGIGNMPTSATARRVMKVGATASSGPEFGQVDLGTAEVTGTLPVDRGGTGLGHHTKLVCETSKSTTGNVSNAAFTDDLLKYKNIVFMIRNTNYSQAVLYLVCPISDVWGTGSTNSRKFVGNTNVSTENNMALEFSNSTLNRYFHCRFYNPTGNVTTSVAWGINIVYLSNARLEAIYLQS